MTKAAVVGTDGREICWGNAPTPWQPAPTGAEIDPEDLFDAAMRAMNAALDAAPEGESWEWASPAWLTPLSFLDPTEARPPPRSPGTTPAGLTRRRSSPTSSAAMPSRNTPAWLCRRCALLASWPGFTATGALRCPGRSTSPTGCSTGLAPSRSQKPPWPREPALFPSPNGAGGRALQLVGAPKALFPAVVGAGQLVGRAEGVVPLRLRGAALSCRPRSPLRGCGAGAIRHGQLLDSCGTAEGMVRAVEPLGGAALCIVVEAGLNAGWHTLPGEYALLGGQTLGLVLDEFSPCLA